jgi:hypothetical protein
VCDGIDNDCDGDVDEGLVTRTYYADTDSDGYGDSSDSVTDCSVPSGYVIDDTDCDDTDEFVNPGETEVCNGIDDNCDGNIDEGLFADYYIDVDGDGFGDSGTSVNECEAPSGYVLDDTDCDDDDDTVHPGATELCDSIDNDCDGTIDEGTTTYDWYADTDGDGFGDAGDTTTSCSSVSGYVLDDTDCDDTDEFVNPDATEVCNGYDDDCDTLIDEGVETTYYIDADADGYGDSGTSVDDCTAPSGYVTDDTDCDDDDDTVNPGETEVCNDVDDDCDGSIDEGLTTTTWYADSDSDGYGDASTSTDDCAAPSGYVADDTDCDDTDDAVNPGETEICNGIDDDCNSKIDDGVSNEYYADTDADGYGDVDDVVYDCTEPSGYVTDYTSTQAPTRRATASTTTATAASTRTPPTPAPGTRTLTATTSATPATRSPTARPPRATSPTTPTATTPTTW